MTEFCAISPTPHLNDFCKGRSHHLVLAHLIETDPAYTAFYRQEADNGSVIICDNSAFEKFKQGEPMYPAEQLMEMADRVKADYIVMPDYPAEHHDITIEAAEKWAPEFRRNGFGTFFCPQSEIGDLDGLLTSTLWAADSDLVDYIGISILNVPNAFAVEKNNKLQRFLSRWRFMGIASSMLEIAKRNGKLIHFLGMVDGPNEIDLVVPWIDLIDTWDSSSPIWAGLNDIQYDMSPTGLVNGKFEKEVDFNFTTSDPWLLTLADQNLKYIDTVLDTYNKWKK